MSDCWASPKEDSSPEKKKFDFGPRITRPKPKDATIGKENIGESAPILSNIRLALVPKKESANSDLTPSSNGNRSPSTRMTSMMPKTPGTEIGKCCDQAHSSLSMKLDIANGRIAQLERERDEWKTKAEAAIANSEQSLGDMLTEIELETLRDEISRLRGMLVEANRPVDASAESSEIANLRLRCAELETQLSTLKKEKTSLEQKHKDNRNADITKIRTLQEQITNERKMRERMANTESALPVVTVGGPSAVTIKPRSAGQTPVPAFVVENASSGAPQQKQAAPTVVDPKLLDKTTLVLPPMAPSSRPLVSQQVLPQSTTGYESIGSDAIADQWRECLADKPSAWRSLLSRQQGTSIFNFGSQRVACKKIGNHTMIQVGRETMLLEEFVDTFGPKEALVVAPLPSSNVLPLTKTSSVTMKSIMAKKNGP